MISIAKMGTAECACFALVPAPYIPASPKKLSSSRSFGPMGLSNLLHAYRKTSSASLCIRSDGSKSADEKTPFGYTRKDVLLIGLGVTVTGVGLKYGLEFAGVDPLKAGNVVQLVMVLGLMVGWVSTYVFRVSSKEMTYAKQLRDYESKVIQKRLEELPEAELESLLAQVEEEKRQLKAKREKMAKPE